MFWNRIFFYFLQAYRSAKISFNPDSPFLVPLMPCLLFFNHFNDRMFSSQSLACGYQTMRLLCLQLLWARWILKLLFFKLRLLYPLAWFRHSFQWINQHKCFGNLEFAGATHQILPGYWCWHGNMAVTQQWHKTYKGHAYKADKTNFLWTFVVGVCM